MWAKVKDQLNLEQVEPYTKIMSKLGCGFVKCKGGVLFVYVQFLLINLYNSYWVSDPVSGQIRIQGS